MSADCTSVDVDKVNDLVHTPTLVQAADMALRLGPTRDWKREFILHLFQAWAYTL